MAPSSVKECICHNRAFAEIKKYANKNNISTVNKLQDQDYCSNSCGLCTPYVKIVLKTGQTKFSPGEPFRKS